MEFDEFKKYKVKDYRHWEVYLHKNQYFLGRLYIWAKRADAVDLMMVANQEREELFEIGRVVNRSLDELFQPDLMNYAALGNIATHLHVHFIPRYQAVREFDGMKFVDENWGKNYAPYNYDFKTPEATLLKLRDLIKDKLG